MAKCLYARGAYVGILSSWSLRECEGIDSIFASELRRRSKNLRTSQTKNLYQPVWEGGLGFQRFSSMVQQRKRNCIHRLLAHGDVWTKLAVQRICTRGHHSPFHSSLATLTPQSIRPGYWISSLLSGPTKPLRSKPCPAPPEFCDSLTGTILASTRCNKAQHAYLRDRHLSTYADVVAWTERISPISSGAGLAHRRLHPALLEPTHRNFYGLHVQYPTGLLSIRHRLQTLAAPSLSPIPYAADSRHQDFSTSALSWSH